MPIQRVLVPLDGTPFAEHALPIAQALARRGHGDVVLLVARALDPPPTEATAAIAMPESGERSLAEYLRRTVERVRGAGDDIAVGGLLLDLPLRDAIQEACAREQVDLIVLATHARGAIGRLLHHSGAHEVLEAAMPVPTLVIPSREGATPTGDAERPIRHLLVWIDDVAPATVIVDAALDLARLTDAAITLTAMRPPGRSAIGALLPVFLPTEPEGGRAGDEEAAARDDAALLDEIAERVRSYGFRVDTRIVRDDAPNALAHCAAEVGADVIVVSRRGHDMGALVHDAELPVLFAHSRT